MRLVCLVEHNFIFVVARGNDPLAPSAAQPGIEKLVDFLLHCEVIMLLGMPTLAGGAEPPRPAIRPRL